MLEHLGLALELHHMPLAEVAADPLQPPLDNHEVLEDELLLDVAQVAQRVDRAHRMGNRIVVERPDHDHQRIDRAQLGKIEGSVPTVLLGDSRHIHVAHRGRGGLVRTVHRTEGVEPRVGYLGDADLHAPMAGRCCVGTLAGEQSEDGRLAT